MPDPSLHHISLTCDDPIAVERFYTRHFGFRRARVVDAIIWNREEHEEQPRSRAAGR